MLQHIIEAYQLPRSCDLEACQVEPIIESCQASQPSNNAGLGLGLALGLGVGLGLGFHNHSKNTKVVDPSTTGVEPL